MASKNSLSDFTEQQLHFNSTMNSARYCTHNNWDNIGITTGKKVFIVKKSMKLRCPYYPNPVIEYSIKSDPNLKKEP